MKLFHRTSGAFSFGANAVGVVAAFALLVPTACTAPQTQDSSTTATADANYLQPLQTSPELRIRDLPVPVGFQYRPEKSMIVEYGATLAATLVYDGNSPIGDVIAFYRREMEKMEWTSKAIFEREDVKMIYTKEGRYCAVTLRTASGLSKRTTITIDYVP